MPETLTLVRAGKSQSGNGWEVADASRTFWLPEKNKEGGSNEPVFQEILTLIDKPADYATYQTKTGSWMIFGKAEPKKFGGGGGAWRNTKEGALFEQSMMNRRTALMTAKDLANKDTYLETVLLWSNTFYVWLQDVGGSSLPPIVGAGVAQRAEQAADALHVEGSSPSPGPTSSPESAVDRVEMESILEDLLRRLGTTCKERYKVEVQQIPVGRLAGRIEELQAEIGGSTTMGGGS